MARIVIDSLGLESTSNIVPNPSFEADAAGSFSATGWTINTPATHSQSISTDFSMFGTRSLKINPATSEANYMYVDLGYGRGQTYSLSWYIKCTAWTAGALGVYVKDTSFGNTAFSQNQTQSVFDWKRVSTTVTTSAFGKARLIFDWNGADRNFIYYIDGVQWEYKPSATTYCDGSLGTGHSWLGTAHNSISLRTSRTPVV